MSTLLKTFASQHRVRVRRSEDGTQNIVGREGEIYKYSDELLAVMVLDSTPRAWRFRKRLGVSVGMTLMQDGDFEGTLTFDPTDEQQAEAAIQIAGVRKKRRLSDDMRAMLREMSRAHGFGSVKHIAGEGAPSGQGSGGGGDG